MELNYRMISEAELDQVSRTLLEMQNEPFFFIFMYGELLINKDMPGIDDVMKAFKKWWRYDFIDDESIEIVDKTYNAIKSIAGSVAANQCLKVWNYAAKSSRDNKCNIAAEKWICEVFDKIDDDAWDKLIDSGYDRRFIAALHTVFHKRYMNGDKRYEHSTDMWQNAIFVYAFNLGREAERNESRSSEDG